MEIVRIFGDENCLLTAFYDNENFDEFKRIFNDWTDIEYLEEFFSKNEKDLNRSDWKGVTIENAVLITRNEANKLRSYFKSLSEKTTNERIQAFKNIFKPLEKLKYSSDYLAKKKVYGLRNKSWLRLYALKVGNDMYVITGGAIKLTDYMAERDHTNKELKKIDICKRYLKNLGLIDEEGLIEYLEL